MESNTISVKMPAYWRKVQDKINEGIHFFAFPMGRVSGKSTGSIRFATITMLQYPYTDVIVARSSYGSIADSSFAEFKTALDELPEIIYNQFELKKSPLRIERVNNSGTVYFIGAGGSNTDRTKGLHTSHRVKIVIVEETQELKTKESYDQLEASLRRNFGEDVIFFVLYNPPAIMAHWINLQTKVWEQDSDWFVVHATWRDIVPFLNDFDIKAILKCKMLEPEYYSWLYEGQPTSAFGAVYPMFRPKKHIISVLELDHIFETTALRIQAVVIGADGAVSRDSTAFTPIALLNNGQAIILPLFIHNPKIDAVISYHQLVQNLLLKWFDDLCRRYHLGTIQEKRMYPNMRLTPIFMRIDSAAPDLIQECRFFLGDRVDINPIQKKTIIEMVGVCQSSLANDNIIIVDYGGYFDYYQNKWIKTEINPLAEQIQSLVWNEKQNGYDPIVPNDISDSWTYGTFFWFSNAENIQFFNILKCNNIKNMLIGDILNKNN